MGRFAFALWLSVVTAACGTDSNFNQLWGGEDGGADTLIAGARAAYDAGDFERAQELAEKAIDFNDQNEEAAVLLGYIYLSAGGIDPYRLARELIKLTQTSDSKSNLRQDSSSSSSSSSTSETLLSLSTLINLSDADIDKLGKQVGGSDDTNYSSTLFNDNKLLQPVEVTDAVRTSINVLDHMNKAVKAICRFVDTSVKVEAETRHQATGCAQVKHTRVLSAKAHFLWAFTHLVEALAFQQVLLFQSGENASGSTSNIESAATDLDNFTGDFSSFIGAVDDMKTAVDAVFDTDSDTSMISVTLNALNAVNLAFAALSGIPSSITSKITNAINKIDEVGSEIGGDRNNTRALKGQMTEKMSKVVAEKIDAAVGEKLAEIPGLDENSTYEDFKKLDTSDATVAAAAKEFEDVCASYDGLIDGVNPDKVDKPDACE